MTERQERLWAKVADASERVDDASNGLDEARQIYADAKRLYESRIDALRQSLDSYREAMNERPVLGTEQEDGETLSIRQAVAACPPVTSKKTRTQKGA